MTDTEINEAGMRRLQADVDAVPPDQQALGLAEAILEESRTAVRGVSTYRKQVALGVIQGNVERLIALLERQAEERDRKRAP